MGILFLSYDVSHEFVCNEYKNDIECKSTLYIRMALTRVGIPVELQQLCIKMLTPTIREEHNSHNICINDFYRCIVHLSGGEDIDVDLKCMYGGIDVSLRELDSKQALIGNYILLDDSSHDFDHCNCLKENNELEVDEDDDHDEFDDNNDEFDDNDELDEFDNVDDDEVEEEESDDEYDSDDL
jgi:hypothetical protein